MSISFIFPFFWNLGGGSYVYWFLFLPDIQKFWGVWIFYVNSAKLWVNNFSLKNSLLSAFPPIVYLLPLLYLLSLLFDFLFLKFILHIFDLLDLLFRFYLFHWWFPVFHYFPVSWESSLNRSSQAPVFCRSQSAFHCLHSLGH